MTNQIETLVANVNNAESLCDLRDALNSLQAEIADTDTKIEELVDICGLKTFGGEEPKSTVNIWSWDAEDVLTYVNGKYVVEGR